MYSPLWQIAESRNVSSTFLPVLCYTHNEMNNFDFSGIDDSDEDEEDLPVQGPLPQEPEDGPWKRNESGIRKL